MNVTRLSTANRFLLYRFTCYHTKCPRVTAPPSQECVLYIQTSPVHMHQHYFMLCITVSIHSAPLCSPRCTFYGYVAVCVCVLQWAQHKAFNSAPPRGADMSHHPYRTSSSSSSSREGKLEQAAEQLCGMRSTAGAGDSHLVAARRTEHLLMFPFSGSQGGF